MRLDNVEPAGLTHLGPQEFGNDKEPNRLERLVELADIEINIAIVQRKTRPGWEQVQIAFEALAQSIAILPNPKAVITSQNTGHDHKELLHVGGLARVGGRIHGDAPVLIGFDQTLVEEGFLHLRKGSLIR